MGDFENAIRDLRTVTPEPRLYKTVLSRQFNLIEGLGKAHSATKADTLGRLCNEVDTWPHDSVKDALSAFYKFSCDYPGIRHAGRPENASRPLDMQDFISVALALTSLTPYLTDGFEAHRIFDGDVL